MNKPTITLIPGDGIGPEVIAATRKLIDATGLGIDWIAAEAGAEVFKKGIASGVPKETIEAISRTRVALKGPLETPVGFGEKSANVTLRKLFETFGNLRPVKELPGVKTPFAGRGVDLIVVRENVEDLYAGIEHMQTPGVAQCLKLISAIGCEKIVRLGFEVARAEGRKTIHCATKANIMKLTEGLLKRTFERIAPEYPDLQASHIIIDNCAHQLVKKPEQFEVIVTTNMNGDIISDLSSALIGGLGFAPSANIGNGIAIFEAVHGSAPKYAGKDSINPCAMILTGVMMLRYLEHFEAAALIENAVFATLQEGQAMTRDVVGDKLAVGTKAFTDTVLANFGKQPTGQTTRTYRPLKVPSVANAPVVAKQRNLIGVDLFVESALAPAELGKKMENAMTGTSFKLKMISNRGTMVYPATGAETDCVDHWRCRLLMTPGDEAQCTAQLTRLLQQVEQAGLRWMHIEKLPEFDNARGFTMAQGEN